jgi:NAD(P)-dependent dehydrogenase (short-subunit alcohol dehydrogenase family)
METNLAGKMVVITGAANGIGRATALSFASEGADLALVDIDAGGLEEVASAARELGAEVSTGVADLSTGPGVSSGIEASLADRAPADILVNNVGAGAVRTFDDLSDDDWDATMQLNFMSAVRAMRCVLPVMRQRGTGVIVNNTSDLARQPEANPVDYAVSKAALLSLTKALARQEAPAIRINAVAPGPVWTTFWTKPGGFAETLGAFHGMPPQEAVTHEMKLRQLPMQRLGTADEVASVIVFLASDLASFVTSSVWGVDGGSIRNLI